MFRYKSFGIEVLKYHLITVQSKIIIAVRHLTTSAHTVLIKNIENVFAVKQGSTSLYKAHTGLLFSRENKFQSSTDAGTITNPQVNAGVNLETKLHVYLESSVSYCTY